MTEELDRVRLQEERLVLLALDEDAAFAIGRIAWDIATARSHSVVIDIRSFDRQLLFLARPGTAANNSEWVRRKSNTVRRFLKSTYRIVLERGGEGVFPPQHGADPADYVISGGGFPLRVAGAGIVGSLTISGLAGRDDHRLAVEVLAIHLGLDPATLALPDLS